MFFWDEDAKNLVEIKNRVEEIHETIFSNDAKDKSKDFTKYLKDTMTALLMIREDMGSIHNQMSKDLKYMLEQMKELKELAEDMSEDVLDINDRLVEFEEKSCIKKASLKDVIKKKHTINKPQTKKHL